MHGTQRKRRPQRQSLQHYLLTIQIAHNVRMHGYLLCDDRRYAVEAANQMVAKAASYPLNSTVLATKLSVDLGIVREIIARRCPEVEQLLAKATDYSFSSWIMNVGDPDDAQLMALH